MSGFDESTYVLQNVAPQIIDEVRDLGSIPHYVRLQEARYDDKGWTQVVKGVANLVEPLDPLFDEDPLKAASNKFYTGSILGMRVIETARGTRFLPDVLGVILNAGFLSDEEDLTNHGNGQADVIMDLAELGLRAPDPNIAIASRWEDALCPDIRLQRYLRSGFGFLLSVSHAIIRIEVNYNHEADLAALQQEVDGGVEHDWSAGLKELGC